MNLQDKQKILNQLAFIHQRLTQTNQYLVDEFEIAKDSIILVTNQFNELKKQVDAEISSDKKDEPIQA